MQITTTVSERDKRLLYFVSVVAFLILFIRFMLVPTLAARDLLKADLQEAQDARSQMEQTLATVSAYAAEKNTNWGSLQTANALYYPLLSSSELDTLVTGLELSHDLQPVSLNIGAPAAQSLSAYTASALAGQKAVLNIGDSFSTDNVILQEITAAFTPDTVDTAYFQTSTVTLRCSGSNEDFLAMLDDLAANYHAVHLDSFTIGYGSYAAATGEVVNQATYTVQLRIILCDKGGVQP